MAYELSPWFSGETPPVRPGVYERQVITLGERRFSYFNGKVWALWDSTPKKAEKLALHESSLQDSHRRAWRGILNNPSQA